MRTGRTRQIQLRFDDHDAFEPLWNILPSESRETIARCYARMLVKAAKVAPTSRTKEEQEHDERPSD